MTLFTPNAVEELSKSLNEPDWMLAFRLAAFDVYQNTPMPTTQDEPWRRTDIRRLKLEEIGPSLNGNGQGTTVPAYLGEPLAEDGGGILLQVDGITHKYELSAQMHRNLERSTGADAWDQMAAAPGRVADFCRFCVGGAHDRRSRP